MLASLSKSASSLLTIASRSHSLLDFVSNGSLLLLEFGLDLLQAVDLSLELIGSLLGLLLDRVGISLVSGVLLFSVTLSLDKRGLVALVLLHLDFGCGMCIG